MSIRHFTLTQLIAKIDICLCIRGVVACESASDMNTNNR